MMILSYKSLKLQNKIHPDVLTKSNLKEKLVNIIKTTKVIE